MVSRRFIQDLLDRVRIEEVVSSYVTLKRSGNSLRGLCPFHNETSPSFHVSPSKGFYYCFGCRSGGNAVKFIQEIEGKSFIEVIRMLAEREGIPVPEEEFDSKAEQREKQRYARQRRHLELLKAAAGLYEKFLWKSPAGERARKYLASRSISEETAGKFRLGYAPEGGIGINALIRSLKVSPQDALDVGLLRHGRDGSFYELFRSRLVFPIIVPGGNVVGFSARALPGTQEEKVKYINSPDTVYFHKGEILYGMAQALGSVRRSGSVILVEGNFDLIAMVQAGFENTAAPLGSALTQRHVEAIQRLGAGIVMLFDGDDGGMRAAHHAFEIIVEKGVPVRIALLPRGEDPHSFLSSSGRCGMEKVLADSRDMVGFMIEQQAQEAGDGDIERVNALRNLWSILKKTPDELVRGEVLKKLPQAFRMSEREVKDYLGFKERARVDAVAAAAPKEKGEAVQKELEIIIGAAIDFPSITPEIYSRSQGIVDDFSVQRILHQLAAAADESRDTGESPDFAGIAEGIVDESLRDWFMRRAVGEGAQFEDEEEALRAALDCLERLLKEGMEREIRQQDQLAHEALEQGDDDRYMKILAEQQKLRRKAKKILY